MNGRRWAQVCAVVNALAGALLLIAVTIIFGHRRSFRALGPADWLLVGGLALSAGAMIAGGIWLWLALRSGHRVRGAFMFQIAAAIPSAVAAGLFIVLACAVTVENGANAWSHFTPTLWLSFVGAVAPFPIEMLTVLLWIFRRRQIIESVTAVAGRHP